jgi:thiosulfate reductase/polysulfide reductase chain A
MCGMCAVRCPIQVQVADGEVEWIQGNPNDSAMGTSLCAKGAAGLSLEYYDDERPKQPLIRSGPRGSGQWRKATWEEALDYVANELRDVIDEYGGQGVVLSDRGGPFNDLTKSFIKALGSPNYFNHDCTCGRNAHHATQSIFGVGRKGVVYDIKNTKHIVLYGRNLIESLQVKEAKEFMEAMTGGAKCTYIDPRATLTASKASRYWRINPNTEYALNLAIIHEVLDKGLYDKEFVSRWGIGLDEIRKKVEGNTPEWQEQHTGVPALEIRNFVQEIAKDAPHVIFHAGWMTARHKQSFYTSRTAHILNALFGAIEVPGGLILDKGPKDAGKKGLNKLVDRIPKPEAGRVDGIGWKHKHWDAGPGLLHLLFPAIETGDPYPVGAYIAYRHDPITAMPDTEEIKKSLDKLKLLVSIDIHYSEFAWYSDVILPEATYLERATVLAQKGGKRPNIQMRDQAIAPKYDTRPSWWIFRELARRLDAGQYFDFEKVEDIWEYQLDGTDVTIPQLREKGVVYLADKPILYDRDQGLTFKTPSGKIEFSSQMLRENGFDDLEQFKPPQEVGQDGFVLIFGRNAVHNHGHTINNPLLNELTSENRLWIHPDRAEKLGIADGSRVEVTSGDHVAHGIALITPWIHPNAVFMLHGFGRTVPLQTRSYKKGVADQRLQKGKLTDYDPVGGGNNLCETVVSINPTS